MITALELPPKIREYLGSYVATSANVALAKRYKLTNQQLDELAGVFALAFQKGFELSDLPNKIKEKLQCEPSSAFLLASDGVAQHFQKFPEYFGPKAPELTQQWKQWARQLGSGVSVAEGGPVEQIITPKKSGMDFNRPVKNSVSVSYSGRISRSKTVGQRISEKRQVDRHVQEQAQQAQVTPEARQRFLTQVRGLTIDALRQGGQPSEARLAKVSEKISQVLEGAPQERHSISQAFRNSPLFNLYQQLGQETIRTSQPIDVVIYQRYQQNQPYLLKEEFDAVAQLIKQIG